MSFFTIMQTVFNSLLRLMAFKITLGSFTFTIGSMIVGLFIISCSVALLQYLFGD